MQPCVDCINLHLGFALILTCLRSADSMSKVVAGELLVVRALNGKDALGAEEVHSLL